MLQDLAHKSFIIHATNASYIPTNHRISITYHPINRKICRLSISSIQHVEQESHLICQLEVGQRDGYFGAGHHKNDKHQHEEAKQVVEP